MDLEGIASFDFADVLHGFDFLKTLDYKIAFPMMQRMGIMGYLQVVPTDSEGIHVVNSRSDPDGLVPTYETSEVFKPEPEVGIVFFRVQVDHLPETDVMPVSGTQVFTVWYLETDVEGPIKQE